VSIRIGSRNRESRFSEDRKPKNRPNWKYVKQNNRKPTPTPTSNTDTDPALVNTQIIRCPWSTTWLNDHLRQLLDASATNNWMMIDSVLSWNVCVIVVAFPVSVNYPECCSSNCGSAGMVTCGWAAGCGQPVVVARVSFYYATRWSDQYVAKRREVDKIRMYVNNKISICSWIKLGLES
jgi:hypothetical protein